MPTLHYPIRVPSDVLEALGEFTGHCWSDSLSLEPFICAAIRNYVRPAPAAQMQPTASASMTCVSPPCAKAAYTKAAHAKASQAHLAERLR
jgi:hypothetical protein